MRRLALFLLLAAPAAYAQCNPALAAHVYNPARLKVIKPCVTVTGTFVDATHGKRRDGVRHEGDGDAHAWLKLDPRQGIALNAKNQANEGGNLVIEPICLYRVTQEDAKAACKDFQNTVVLPPVGSHVRVTGPLVLDTQHGHIEVHPISNLEVIP